MRCWKNSAALRDLHLNYRATPRSIDQPPYNGRKVAVVEGPAGEWLELIESNSALDHA